VKGIAAANPEEWKKIKQIKKIEVETLVVR
jgi:hypothetical protein